MLIKHKSAQYPETGKGSAEGVELCFSPLCFHLFHPDSARASTDLLLTTAPLCFSETRRNNLLSSVELLQVRKQLPNTMSCLWGFIACGAGTACTDPVLWIPAGCAWLWAGAQGPSRGPSAALSLCSGWQQPHG